MMLRFSAFKTLSFCLRDCRSCANGITSSAYTFGAHVETLQRIIATVMLHRKPKLQSMPCELMTRCYHTLQSFSIKKHKVVHVYSVLYSIFSYFILLHYQAENPALFHTKVLCAHSLPASFLSAAQWHPHRSPVPQNF